MPKITPNITDKAKAIYDNLPATTNKSGWVSDAIIEKAEKAERGTLTEDRVREIVREELRKRVDGK
jgi:hypothetical protein